MEYEAVIKSYFFQPGYFRRQSLDLKLKDRIWPITLFLCHSALDAESSGFP